MTQRPRPKQNRQKAGLESILPRESNPASEPAAPIAAAPVKNRGQFQPGNDMRRRAPPRRTPNKLTQDLKQGIIDGAVKHGRNGKGAGGLPGYCYYLAAKHPKAYVSLLAKIIPMQVHGNIEHNIGAVNIVAVPTDHYISGEDMARLAAPGLLELEPIEQDNESQTLPPGNESGKE